MKGPLVPIDKAGRVVLPKEVREELELSVQGDEITLRLNREKTGCIKRGNALVFSTGGPDLLENDVVENIRSSERDSLRLKGFPDQKPK
jgi:AbrB family looped-hinge helix DNA binding protein